MDYAEHTDEHADLAQRQATMLYVERLRDVEALLDMLKEEVAHHAEFARKEGIDFGHCGDLGHMRQLLVEALAFLAQQDEKDIEQALSSIPEGR